MVKLVTVKVDPPDPESFVKTLPVKGVSSGPVFASSTMEGVLFMTILATEDVTFPHT